MTAPRPDFIELPVGDIAAAKSFYEQAFGWELAAFGPSYACTLTGDVDIGLQADAAERCAAPLPVIRVDDLDGTQAAILAAGGTLTRPIFAFPGGKRFHFRDPAGNELAAHRPDLVCLAADAHHIASAHRTPAKAGVLGRKRYAIVSTLPPSREHAPLGSQVRYPPPPSPAGT